MLFVPPRDNYSTYCIEDQRINKAYLLRNEGIVKQKLDDLQLLQNYIFLEGNIFGLSRSNWILTN